MQKWCKNKEELTRKQRIQGREKWLRSQMDTKKENSERIKGDGQF